MAISKKAAKKKTAAKKAISKKAAKKKTSSRKSASKGGVVVRLEIPVIEEERFLVLLEGETPLIQHAWSPWNRAEMLGKQFGKKPERRKRDPQSEIFLAIEADEDYQPSIRSTQIKKAMVRACRFMEGITMTRAQGAVYVTGDHWPLYGLFEPREDMVRLASGVADIRFRPMWTEWYTQVEIVVPGGALSQEGVYNLLEAAGKFSGIGDKRPEQNGETFGRFRVVRAEDRTRILARIRQLKPQMKSLAQELKTYHQEALAEIFKRLGIRFGKVGSL